MSTINNRIVVLTKDNQLIEILFKDIGGYEYNINSITISYNLLFSINKQDILIQGKNGFNEPFNFNFYYENCIEHNKDLFIQEHKEDNQRLFMFSISIPDVNRVPDYKFNLPPENLAKPNTDYNLKQFDHSTWPPADLVDFWFEFLGFTICIDCTDETIEVKQKEIIMFKAHTVEQAIEFCLNYNQYKKIIL